ncbi:hypothetical protein EV424DRAFT_1538171 [Suillus variegatus]|nr:hypothetical protein EV424DRAFT_1538171 [Suillus variegatus]
MYPRSGKTSGSMLQPSLRISPVPTKQIFYHPLNAVSRYSHPVGNTSYPGNVTIDTLGTCLNDVSTIINLRNSSLQAAVCQVNPEINLEIFVHKVEILQENDKIDEFEHFFSFYLTSTYDHSLPEAFYGKNRSMSSALTLPHRSLSYSVKSVDSSPVDQAMRNLSCNCLPMLNSFRLLYRFNLNDPRIISQYQGPTNSHRRLLSNRNTINQHHIPHPPIKSQFLSFHSDIAITSTPKNYANLPPRTPYPALILTTVYEMRRVEYAN